jgi:hypothetical protein
MEDIFLNRRHFLAASAAAAATLVFSPAVMAQEVAPGLSQDLFTSLDAVVSRTMAAYNAGDWKKFYADYAKQVAATETEGAFTALYTNMAKKTFGNFKSKSLIAKRSSFPGPVGLLVYAAQMDKGKADLSVNFFKEGDTYKIQQVRFDPPKG